MATALTIAACSAGSETIRTGPSSPTAKTAAPASASAPAPGADPHLVRRPLGPVEAVALAVELMPMAGRDRVLAVADDGLGGSWASVAGETGIFGKERHFEGARVVAASEGSDGRTTFVTSDGDRLCIATYKRDAAAPDASGCESTRPEAVIPIGDKLALLHLEVKESAVRVAARPRAPSVSVKKSAPKSTKKDGAKKADGAPKKKSPAQSAAKNSRKKKRTSEPVKVVASKATVSVSLSWATRDGAFDATRATTGLSFERPLPGMMLIDAVSRGSVADVLFYEALTKPKKRSKTPYGSARLAVASLGADGSLVGGSRAALLEGDLEYGSITGWNAPRLVATGNSTTLVAFAGRGGSCQAQRVLPSRADPVMSRAGCQVDPAGWTASSTGALDAILGSQPRRAPGQTKSDSPLAVWAQDRAFFTSPDGSRVSTATLTDGTPAPATPPLVRQQSRIAWGAFAPDGEGTALSAGRLFHVSAAGDITEALGSQAIDALGARAAEILRAPSGPGDRRRAAKIGATFFYAHHDVIRLGSPPVVIEALAGRAHPDATALVGGRDRGALIDVASGLLRVLRIDEAGAKSAETIAKSPVRAGFDAVERAAGGALVAGVSAADPPRVVAFTIDTEGRASAPRPTSLAVAAGTFGVRLVPLPAGGALLTDKERRRVVWLDDHGAEQGAAALPEDHAQASCSDGRPAPLSIPSPEPNKLVRVADLSAPGTCLTSELAWTSSGALRWFGATELGLRSVAELGVVPGAFMGSFPPAPSMETNATAAPNAPAAPSEKPVCPPEMVSIAGRFCIDRFEATLVDAKTARPLSPDYPPTPNLLEIVLGDWATDRAHWGDVHARAFPLPHVPSWQRGTKTEPVAIASYRARPNGYVTGLVAASACAAAGKRLCALDEHTTACRGEGDTDFPYGTEYQDGVCNVFREDHPAALLHHNASFGHLDPRLNRVRAKGKPLFETAGARPACRSVWGSDAVYDLVGNLDEWVDEEEGAFAGGFYARSTRAGCDAVITAHPRAYADYSTGIRCCKDAAN